MRQKLFNTILFSIIGGMILLTFGMITSTILHWPVISWISIIAGVLLCINVFVCLKKAKNEDEVLIKEQKKL